MNELRRLAHLARNPRRAMQFARAMRNPADSVPILSASIGRVGSTLSWQALVRSRARHLTGEYRPVDWRIISDMCWDLARYFPRRGSVCKTHDFPDGLDPRHDLRVVFLHGRPSDAALSVYRCLETEGRAWVEDHFRHMHADGGIDELLDRDVMRIEAQIDAWRSIRGRKVLCLGYEGLWQHVDTLSDFVGFRVDLPKQRARHFDDLDPALVARARERYARLDEKVAAMPLCEIVGD